MRLKSLNIKGFKSFANDTLLHFNEDVIGIVGPNGSGKSNIVDAIRWVLGEQKSKELRLEAMSDVIFNGTKTKKEAPTAMVALTFENDKGILPTEYQTVEISRTLYRSGESEYRLNNVLCRLKDIHSLLIDTGIGSNSYAIIALGMVDDILNDKDDSRRRMFEQAAGISKYKIRKKETLNKLKSATEDLNRIDDLLYEIEGNLKALEKQAKRAQKYLEIRDSYKDLSLKYSVAAIHNLKLKYKNVADTLANDQDTYRNNDVVILKITAQIEKDRKHSVDKELSISSQQKTLNELVYKIRSLEHEKNLLKQKLEFIENNKQKINATLQNADTELKKVQRESGQISNMLEEAKAQEKVMEIALKQSKEHHENTKIQYSIVKKTEDENLEVKQSYEKQIFENEKSVAIDQNSLDNYARENERLQDQISKRRKEIEDTSAKLQKLHKDGQQLSADLTVLQENEEKRKTRLLEAEKLRDTLQESLNKVNRIIDSKQNEYDLLKSMIDSYEGFAESNKFISQEWKDKSVQIADIFDVDESYKAAIEWLLEDVLHHFVVKSEEEALAGIALLRHAQKGKAKFILLNRLTSKKASKKVYPDMICARDVVHCQPEYDILADHLFGQTYIYNGSNEAFSTDQIPETVISKRGTILYKPFEISGGSVGLFEGKKIGRKQNLDKLAHQLDDNNGQKSKIQNDLSRVKSDIDLLRQTQNTRQIDNLRKDLEVLNQEKAKAQSITDNVHQWIADTEEQIKQNKQSQRDVQKSIDITNEKIQSLRLVLTTHEARMLQADGQGMDVVADNLAKASEAYNTANIALIRHQNLLLNYQKDLDFKQSRMRELEASLLQNNERLLHEEKEKINIQDDIIGHTNALEQMNKDKVHFQSTLSEVEQLYFASKNEMTAQEDALRKLTKEQNALQHKIQDLKDAYSDQKFQIQSIAERTRIEFGININDIINNPEYATESDFEQLQTHIDSVRQKLQSFGDVNPLALEAYAEMKERYDNMMLQRKDILDSRDSLMETIDAIEGTATQMFMDSFEKIRVNFIQVFRSLFTQDDTCDLIILDPERPLESDIDIIAKPKGKKPKSLSQLSGGEKTLTATALLFALYLLKPAPFCIFDEVDAPLDDANIQKFNNIIRDFSKESQFIIVTHNKSTMAEVNTLYGVYMQEQGVSAVSAVDFRSLKHDPKFEYLN
ncbi:MAG: chromosome segregation protein SMC [Saprospiraceae bacterium]